MIQYLLTIARTANSTFALRHGRRTNLQVSSSFLPSVLADSLTLRNVPKRKSANR
jgi:hypothetical protein